MSAPPPQPREVSHRYEDPLDRIWLSAARRIGLKVERSEEVFASTDGRGTLLIGANSHLDPDDCLAQMIFHELCHSLVEGPESLDEPDWGLGNVDLRDLNRERACLRLQASLAGAHGLRRVLAPTTDHRAYYDQLGPDPLAGPDPSAVLARAGHARVDRAPWRLHLRAALAATEAVIRATAPWAEEAGRRGGAPSLFSLLEPAPERHPLGFLLPEGEASARCEACVWRSNQGGQERCLHAGEGEASEEGPELDPSWPACLRFEEALSCLGCGACCREAYGSVEVDAEEPAVAGHPELFTERDGRLVLRRVGPNGERCAALRGELSEAVPYTCIIYEERPQTCRDFTLGSAHCLTARRRVGLSR